MYKYLLIIGVLFIQQCKQNNPPESKAFYYWKTFYNVDNQESQLMNHLGVDKFYIRFFDVDWSVMRDMAIPLGELQVDYEKNLAKNYVPCIFITNTVMLKSSKNQLDTLANRIRKKTYEIAKYLNYEYIEENGVQKEFTGDEYWNELQIDCDWTVTSKENYFYFLKKIKEAFPLKKLSITLRLWQLKYQQKAGIPPADRAMLMCYSTGDPREYQINNSLATYDEISKYIKGQSYVLPIDIALPIYHWAVLFRNKKFKGILRDLDPETIQSDTIHYAHIQNNRYFFKSDTVLANTYIRYGDEIRLESLPEEDMKKLIKLLKKEKFYTTESTVSFFSWDTTYINNYGKENIENYYNCFN